VIMLTYSRFCVCRKITEMNYPISAVRRFTDDGELVWKRVRSMRPTFERKRARNERRDGKRFSIDRKRKIVMTSESPLAKTRPGLQVLAQTHHSHYAIMVTHLSSTCALPRRPRPRFPLCNLYLLNN